MKTPVVLLAACLLHAALGDDYDEEQPRASCENRCLRIHERSLDRIGFSKVGADRYIDKPKTDSKTMRDVCWKQYDYFYCMKGCVKSKEHEKYSRHVKSRCKHAVEDLDSGLSCLFKYRSFLEIRCSSFLNEAIRLKQADDPELLPDKETCRYLHLNALCLENSVSSFCPQATPFFRRLNLRDFFLNHILPTDDELFDDQDLDACQLKDFVKEALEGVKVSPRRLEEHEMATTTSHSTTISPTSTVVSIIDESEEDDSEESWPSTTLPPIVRTLSPSTRVQTSIQTSTTSNFVYTTPARNQTSSTLVGTASTPIHITKEQAIRTSTARGGDQRGQKITVTPKSHSTTTTARPTTRESSFTTSRRRLFDSDEDFSQTPPNFFWGSFRGENYKLARNYSDSFPPNAQFVTPVAIESSSIFGDDDDSRYDNDDDYGRPQVIDIDREPVTVTGRPVKMSTIVTLTDEEKEAPTMIDEERSSSPVYEHAVDTQLQPTTDLSRPLPLDSAESTTPFRVTPESELSSVSRILPTDSYIDEEEDQPEDENEIPAITEREKDRNRAGFHPEEREFEVVHHLEKNSDNVNKKESENNFDRALQREKEDEESDEIQKEIASDDQMDMDPTRKSANVPEAFTPLINGGRVAVKSIKQFRVIGEEESAQDWTEDPNMDDSRVDLEDFDDYDKETHVISAILPDEPREVEVRRRINFILAYTSLFFVLLLLVVCCILFVIIKNRRSSHMDRPYKMHDSV